MRTRALVAAAAATVLAASVTAVAAATPRPSEDSTVTTVAASMPAAGSTAPAGTSAPMAPNPDVKGDISMIAAEYTPEMKPFFDALVADFSKVYPNVKVTVDVVSWNDIDQKVTTLVQTKQMPDIANLNYFASFAADDLLYPADQIVSQKTLDDLVQTFRDNSKYNGTEYAVPDLASARLFFYNKDVLDKAGITAPPATWADLEAACTKIKETQPDVIPLALPLGPEEAQAEFLIWAGANGGRVFADGKWTINSEANVKALEFLKGLVDKGCTQPSPGTTNRTDGAFPLFAQGKAAMMNGAIFFPGELKKANSAVNFAVAPIPVAQAGTQITLGVQDYFFAFKKEGNQPAVQAFLDFLFIPENYAKFLKAAGGFLPATKSAGAAMSSDAALAPFIAALPGAFFYPSDQKAWPATQGMIQQQIGTAVASGGDPKTVLDAIQSEAETASA